MSAAAIPQVNYVTDSKGQPVFVQMTVQDWAFFVEEYRRLATLLAFREGLKNAFREVRQIQKGEKQAVTLAEFLHEL